MIELLSTLFVTTPGTSLHLDGDAIPAYHPDTPGRQLIPLLRIDHIVAWNGVDVSNDLIHRCAADGRSITWVNRNGRFLARSSGPQHGNPYLRLAQYRAFDTPARRLAIAAACVAGKLHNYRQLLLRAARDATGSRQTQLRQIAAGHADAVRTLPDIHDLGQLLGIEGNAARDYFQALDLLARQAGTGIGSHGGVPPAAGRSPGPDPGSTGDNYSANTPASFPEAPWSLPTRDADSSWSSGLWPGNEHGPTRAWAARSLLRCCL